MGVHIRNQVVFWFLISIAFIGFLYLFQSILMPFVLGLGIAYLLNPLVNGLNKYKMNRGMAAMFILLCFFVVLGIACAFVVPIIISQGGQLIQASPDYIDSLMQWAEPHFVKLSSYIPTEYQFDWQAALKKNTTVLASFGANVLNGVASGGERIFGMASLVIFTPVVAYFFMKEWDVLRAWVDDLMPKHYKETIKDLLKQIDVKISGFIRGQITIAIVLGLGYAIALSIAGLKYGALIGIVSGLLSVIPMVGSIVGLLISVAVAWFQAGDIMFVALIAGIFIVGQILEGNFLSPKIMGDNVGLHPLWVFFALFAGGALLGILGMFLAVPVAAIIGVLMAFGIKQYKDSAIYKGNFVADKAKPKAAKAKAKTTSAKIAKAKSVKAKSVKAKTGAKKDAASKPAAKKSDDKK